MNMKINVLFKLIILFSIFISTSSQAMKTGDGIVMLNVSQCEKFKDKIDVDCEYIFEMAKEKSNEIAKNFTGIVNCAREFGKSCGYSKKGEFTLFPSGVIYFTGYGSIRIEPILQSKLINSLVTPSGCPIYPGEFNYFEKLNISKPNLEYDFLFLNYRSLFEKVSIPLAKTYTTEERYLYIKKYNGRLFQNKLSPIKQCMYKKNIYLD